MQANWQTTLLNYTSGVETRLPNITKAQRTYPAAGAIAMLPLTVSNGYTPTLLFCGGMDPVRDEFVFSSLRASGFQLGAEADWGIAAGTTRSGPSSTPTPRPRAYPSTLKTPLPPGSTTTTSPRTAYAPPPPAPLLPRLPCPPPLPPR